MKKLLGCTFLTLVLAPVSRAAQPGVRKSPFGTLPGGRKVALYTLTNRAGMVVKITTYGARIQSIIVPDRRGQMADVVLGFDHLAGYLGNDPFFGAIIGRYANRIGGARFTLDGKVYHLPANDGKNCLHGGPNGFDKQVWTAHVLRGAAPALALTYFSKNGEAGFPGNLHIKVVYTLLADNALRIQYTASTDRDTVVNFTNHSYFNLAGQGNGTILHQLVMLNASRFTPIGPTLIPTGKLENVAGTPLDFRRLTPVGARINANYSQLKYAGGYDFNWVLNRGGKKGLVLAARAVDPGSGRELEVFTTEPGVQFYTGNFLDGTIHGKGGKAYLHRGAFTFETQHYPDSPNQPNFPTTELKPGQTYHQTTIFKFLIWKPRGKRHAARQAAPHTHA